MTETPSKGSEPREEPGDQSLESLEVTEEPLEATLETVEDPWEEPAGQEPATKRCLFCGTQLPLPARACHGCGHALGPFEPSTPKEYFRWFFCGMLIVVGGFMPCGPHGQMTLGTLMGGAFFIMGLGVLWNMWAAIYTGRFKMFWVTMLILPAVWGVWRLATAFAGDPSVAGSPAAVMAAHGVTNGWASLGEAFSSSPPKWGVLRNFLWVVGYGPFFITAGSVLAWLFLVGGFFGAMKHSKKKMAERASAGGARNRRR